jgi:hypothetical protein
VAACSSPATRATCAGRHLRDLRADPAAGEHLLGISERIIKSHLTSVFQRIGVTDRTQAALWAERNGLRQP